MPQINTVNTVNPVYTTNANPFGARANIHMADEGFLAEQQHTRNALASFNKGIGEAVNTGLQITQAVKDINKKYKVAKDKTDSADYLNKMNETISKFQVDNSNALDSNEVSKNFNNTISKFNTNYGKEYNISAEALTMASPNANRMLSDASIRNYSTTRKNNTKVLVQRNISAEQSLIDNGTFENKKASDEQYSYLADTMTTLVPYDKVSQKLSFDQRFEFSAYSKLVANAPEGKYDYASSKILSTQDKKTLYNAQVSGFNTYKKSVHDGMKAQYNAGTLTKPMIDEWIGVKAPFGKDVISSNEITNFNRWIVQQADRKVAKEKVSTYNNYNKSLIALKKKKTTDLNWDEYKADAVSAVGSIKNLTIGQYEKFESIIKAKETETDIEFKMSKENKLEYNAGKKIIEDYGNQVVVVDKDFNLESKEFTSDEVLTEFTEDQLTKYNINKKESLLLQFKLQDKLIDYCKVDRKPTEIKRFADELIKPHLVSNYKDYYQMQYAVARRDKAKAKVERLRKILDDYDAEQERKTDTPIREKEVKRNGKTYIWVPSKNKYLIKG